MPLMAKKISQDQANKKRYGCKRHSSILQPISVTVRYAINRLLLCKPAPASLCLRLSTASCIAPLHYNPPDSGVAMKRRIGQWRRFNEDKKKEMSLVSTFHQVKATLIAKVAQRELDRGQHKHLTEIEKWVPKV